jgi:hypothetical protein
MHATIPRFVAAVTFQLVNPPMQTVRQAMEKIWISGN